MASPPPDPRAGGFALLTIDMQRDFALPSSPAHIPGTAEEAEQNRTLVKGFRSPGRPILHMVRLYLPDGSNAELSRRAYLEAGNQLVCAGTSGAELLDPLKPDPGVSLDPNLLMSGRPQQVGPAEWINTTARGRVLCHLPRGSPPRSPVESVVIWGCNFPNRPRTTIYEATERDFHIVFVPDATSGVYARGLDELRGIGVAIQDAEQFVSWLRELPLVGGQPSSSLSARARRGSRPPPRLKRCSGRANDRNLGSGSMRNRVGCETRIRLLTRDFGRASF